MESTGSSTGGPADDDATALPDTDAEQEESSETSWSERLAESVFYAIDFVVSLV